jgi:hypothetical protein
MAALGRSFDLHYKSSAPINELVTGTYKGSLKRVVARLLADYDFVLKSRGGRIEITVLATHKAKQAVVGTTAIAAPKVVVKKPAGPPVPVPAKAHTHPNPSLPSPTIKFAEGPALAPPIPVPGSVPFKAPEPEPSTAAPTPGADKTMAPEVLPIHVQPPAPPTPTTNAVQQLHSPGVDHNPVPSPQ